ncbi:MAG TPA: CDP-alcohol phosphatidyltransferase family protein [Candidatus Binatia bacterium]
MNFELKYTLAVALVVLFLVTTYGVRVLVKGRAHFDRIDRQGGSRLLSKGAMEIGYWILSPLARALVSLRVTPNQISWMSFGFGALAGVFLALGHFGFGAICATLCGLLDSVDGMVARLSGAASDAGEVLDAAIDRYVEFFFLVGLIIYYREQPVLQLLALIALLGSFMVSYSTTKAEALQIEPPNGLMRRPERAVYLTAGAALSAPSIAWFERTPEFSIPLAYPMVLALSMVAVFANFSAVERFWLIARALRQRELKPAELYPASNEKKPLQTSEPHVTEHSADIGR